jgi:hypothetical protein
MECIWGKPIDEYEAMFGPGFHGRPAHKEWMYDVVCNRHSGLDVGTCGWARNSIVAVGLPENLSPRSFACCCPLSLRE